MKTGLKLEDYGRDWKLLRIEPGAKTQGANLAFREYNRILEQNREMISETLRDSVAKGAKKIILDISGCSYLNSGGISVFVNAARILGRKGKFVIITQNQTVHSALEVTGLYKTAAIYFSLQDFEKAEEKEKKKFGFF
ncbi:MAG: STAS domain-containing protein [Fibrobacterota bacterium]